jgi:hypothetical protein
LGTSPIQVVHPVSLLAIMEAFTDLPDARRGPGAKFANLKCRLIAPRSRLKTMRQFERRDLAITLESER